MVAVEPPDVISRIARTQDGVVTAAQALAAGLTRRDIRDLCRARRWRRLALGAYFVFAGDLSPPRRALIRAAVTSFGPLLLAQLQKPLAAWR